MASLGNSGPTVIERAAERLQSARRSQRGRHEPPAAAVPAVTAPEPPPETTPATAPVPKPTTDAVSRPRAAHIDINLKRLPKVGIFLPESTSNRTTEEFRLIKQATLQRVSQAAGAGTKNANLIMVTSAREGEGKSFIAANLAMSIAAEKDRSVLLIDADASRSSIAQYLDIKVARGLLDALEDEHVTPHDVLVETNIEGLYLIPAGPKRALSAELYSSERMGGFLDQIIRNYPSSIVVFDAPPVLATGEPSALAQHMGQTVFVVESGRTSQTAISESLNLINICPQIGFVFNKAQFQFGAVRFGNYYDYYSKK